MDIKLRLTSFDHLIYDTKEHRVARLSLSAVCICFRNVIDKPNFGSADYSAYVVYTKTIILTAMLRSFV